MKRSEIRFPTILGLLVAIMGLGSGLFLLGGQLRTSTSASVENAPKEVIVSNVSESGFAVSWHTEKALSGYVQYGEEGDEVELIVADDRDQEKGEVGNYFTHYVTIKGLKPSTKYNFKIGSGADLYDNGGSFYNTTTAIALTNSPAADVAYGMVVTANGEPADGAIVYLEMPGATKQSALVKSSGSWVIPLATARSSDLSQFANYDKEQTSLSLFVQGGTMGTASLVVDTANDAPVTQIALTPIDGGMANTQSVEDGNNNTFQSNAIGGENMSTTEEVKILTPSNLQPVQNDDIEIVGQAPAGTEIEIEIHSEAVVNGKVIAGNDGMFKFEVPKDLEPGEHTITVRAMVNGVLQTVTRSFTVYAAEETGIPFYSATPSATTIPSPTAVTTLTPTVKPTVTISPTKTPSPTKSPTPTQIPRTTNPSTESAIPNTGNEFMTWILLGVGILLITGGTAIYKRIG